MRLLLDTHVWLWMLSDPPRLTHEARELISDPENELLLSAVSSWEISIKFALGKLGLPEPPAEYVPSRMIETGVVGLPIEHAHALAVATLPSHHRDPFDRILIAQAMIESIPIITADEQFIPYDVQLVGVGRGWRRDELSDRPRKRRMPP